MTPKHNRHSVINLFYQCIIAAVEFRPSNPSFVAGSADSRPSQRQSRNALRAFSYSTSLKLIMSSCGKFTCKISVTLGVSTSLLIEAFFFK